MEYHMQALFASFNAMFNALTVLFGATTHYAKAVDNIGQWCEESTGAFADEARENRKENLIDARIEREERRALRKAAQPAQLTD